MKELHPKSALLWLGSYQSDEIFQGMLARTIGQASAYASQKGLIKGFDQILEADWRLDTIGSINYPAYPVYPKKSAERIEWSRSGESYDVNIGSSTVKYVNYLSRDWGLRKEVCQWAKNRSGTERNIVIIYEPSVAKLKAAKYLKEKYDAKVFVIIPDIPELVNLGASKLIKIAKKVSAEKQKRLFESVDGFILYSSHMAKYYGFSDNKWILMEGVFDPDEAGIATEEAVEDGVTKLMYCGALDEFRGTPQLLEAFDELRDKPYELWLTGAGRSEKLIKERAEKDPRIKYFGYLDSREEVIRLEQQADILIHTRDVNSPAAPYCFPSKLFEYLAAGKPVLSVDIPGIPREYFDYMITIEKLSGGYSQSNPRGSFHGQTGTRSIWSAGQAVRTQREKLLRSGPTNYGFHSKIVQKAKEVAISYPPITKGGIRNAYV